MTHIQRLACQGMGAKMTDSLGSEDDRPAAAAASWTIDDRACVADAHPACWHQQLKSVTFVWALRIANERLQQQRAAT